MNEPPIKPELPDNWEPPAHHRQYFRSSMSGQLGYLVRVDGKDAIRIDRPNERLYARFNPDQWVPEEQLRPMSEAAMALIAFNADRALCQAIGEHELARKEFHHLSDEKRMVWMRTGPKNPPIRAALYKAIMRVLRGD